MNALNEPQIICGPLNNITPTDASSTSCMIQQQQQQQHSLFSQASWGRLEMKPERNKFKVQAH